MDTTKNTHEFVASEKTAKMSNEKTLKQSKSDNEIEKHNKIQHKLELTTSPPSPLLPSKNTLQPASPTPPPYLKLIVDCWEKIFDYLSFKDILVFGQTCKRINFMVGYYVREYNQGLSFTINKNKINFQYECDIQTEFYTYITRLNIVQNSSLNDIFSNSKTAIKFESLTTLHIERQNLMESKTRQLDKVLEKIENFHLISCELTKDIFIHLANYCPKIKCLDFRLCGGTHTALFSQHYPSLNRLQFRMRPANANIRIDELKMFLEKHKQLNLFEIDCRFLWSNRDIITKTNCNLDMINIRFDTLYSVVPFNEFIVLLNQLYKRDFYKKLKLTFPFGIHEYIIRTSKEQITTKIATLPGLYGILIDNEMSLDLKCLTELKELNLIAIHSSLNMKIIAENLQKLRRLTIMLINDVNSDIIKFIHKSKNLKSIEIFHSAKKTINLIKLNQERNQLKNACHTTFYVQDNVYLPTKWMSNDVNLKFITVSRIDKNQLYSIYS